MKEYKASYIRELFAHPLASLFFLLLLGSSIWSQCAIFDVSKVEYPRMVDVCCYDLSGDFLMENTDESFAGYKAVDLSYGDSFLISGSLQTDASTESLKGIKLVLFSPDGIILSSAEAALSEDSSFEARLDYYRACERTTDGILYVCVESTTELMGELTIERDEMVSGIDATSKLLFLGLCVVDIFILACLILNLFFYSKSNSEGLKKIKNIQLEFSSFRVYILIVFVILIFFFFINRGWDLRLPYVYTRDVSDTKFLFPMINMIDKGFVNLVGYEELGGTSVFRSLDFLGTDRLHLMLIWLICRLSDNVFIIANVLYLVYYLLNGVASGYVCKKLGYSDKTALVVSTLFAMSVFAQMRYNHLVYVGYFMVPFVILLVIRLMREDNEKQDGKKIGGVWSAMIIMFITANTGLYYTYFGCFLLVVAILYVAINRKGGKNILVAAASIVSSILGVMFNLTSNFLYFCRNGINSYSDVNNRLENDVVKYSLSLLQLLFPRYRHRCPLLSDITQKYIDSWDFLSFEGHNLKNLFINENLSSTAGLVADIGIVILFLLLMKKNKKGVYEKYGILLLACLALGLVSCGGTIIGYLVYLPVRSYNRISIVIVFIALLGFSEFIEGIIKKLNNIVQFLIVTVILLVGVLDQNVDYSYSDGHAFLLEQLNFMERIDERMSDGSKIFCLPYWNWHGDGQRNYMMGAALTEGLVWSCGAEQGRPEALWQKGIAGLEPSDMAASLKNAGYDAVFLDKYDAYMTESDFEDYVVALTVAIGTEPMVSENGNEYFWILNR